MRLSNSQKAILALIIANLIWGAASPIFKWSLTNIEPFTLAFLRFGIGTLLLLPFCLKHLKIDTSDITKLVFIAMTSITINISFFFVALKYTASINAPIIASAGPIFVIISSMIFLKEKPKQKTILGALIGLFGVAFIVATPLFEEGVNLSFLGNLFLVIATCGAVAHAILTKEIITKYSALTITFYSFVIGTFSFLPAFVYESTTYGLLPNLTTQGIVGIVFGAVFASALAYYLYHWAFKYLLASEVGLFAYLDPIVAIVIAFPLLGEIPTFSYIVGSLLVFGGIYIAEGRIHYHPLGWLHRYFFANSPNRPQSNV